MDTVGWRDLTNALGRRLKDARVVDLAEAKAIAVPQVNAVVDWIIATRESD
jgi:hypothetical protein